MKLPKFSNLVRKREDGKTAVGGLTGPEWGITIFALCVLWIVQALIFAGLLSAATAVRDARGRLFPRPGREICLFGEPGCARVNPVKS